MNWIVLVQRRASLAPSCPFGLSMNLNRRRIPKRMAKTIDATFPMQSAEVTRKATVVTVSTTLSSAAPTADSRANLRDI